LSGFDISYAEPLGSAIRQLVKEWKEGPGAESSVSKTVVSHRRRRSHSSSSSSSSGSNGRAVVVIMFNAKTLGGIPFPF
jgi:hypothetical protein